MLSGLFTLPKPSQQGPPIYNSLMRPRGISKSTCRIIVDALTHTLQEKLDTWTQDDRNSHRTSDTPRDHP